MPTLDITPEQMAYGGAALARHEGRVFFVPYTLPGERVRVRVRESDKRWAEAEVVEILEPSADRVAPRCAHFGPHGCGGCQWQHIEYEAQRRYKTEIVREQLQRIAKIEAPPVQPCLGIAEPWHYRNHVQLHTTPDGPGFHRADGHGVEPLRECHVLNEAIAPLFDAVKGHAFPGVKRVVLRGSAQTGERLMALEGERARLPDSLTALADEQRPALHDIVGGRRWRIGARSFFQVNSEGAELLLATVRALLGPLRGDERLLDGYAGVGFFGLSLATEVGHVWLVESHPAAIADARRHSADMDNVTIVHATTEAALAAWDRHGPRPDIALLDPPRVGCAEAVLGSLEKLAVPTIIYVSCDPATQARDIRRLLDRGYQLETVQPVDLFPHTYHIESVARLTIGSRAPLTTVAKE